MIQTLIRCSAGLFLMLSACSKTTVPAEADTASSWQAYSDSVSFSGEAQGYNESVAARAAYIKASKKLMQKMDTLDAAVTEWLFQNLKESEFQSSKDRLDPALEEIRAFASRRFTVQKSVDDETLLITTTVVIRVSRREIQNLIIEAIQGFLPENRASDLENDFEKYLSSEINRFL